jgi:hypothetical protein
MNLYAPCRPDDFWPFYADSCNRATPEGRMIVHIAVLVAQCTEGHGVVLSIVSPVCDAVDGPPG